MIITKDALIKLEELMQSDVEEALTYCQQQFIKSNNYDWYIYIGDCYMSLEEYELALENLNSGIDNMCSNMQYAKNLKAEALFYLEDYLASKELFKEIKKLDPSSFFATAYLIECEVYSGNIDNAITIANEALKSDYFSLEDKAHFCNSIGHIKFKYKNDIQGAKEFFVKALENDSNCAQAYIGLGQCNLIDSQYEDAIKDFEIAIDLGEGTLETYIGIATGYKGLGCFEDALEYYKVVYNAAPSRVDILNEINEIKKLL